MVESYRPGYLSDLGLGIRGAGGHQPRTGDDLHHTLRTDRAIQPVRWRGDSQLRHGLIMSISGLQDREPLKHGGFQAQYEGGLNGAAATAMALFMQGNTGEGQHL